MTRVIWSLLQNACLLTHHLTHDSNLSIHYLFVFVVVGEPIECSIRKFQKIEFTLSYRDV